MHSVLCICDCVSVLDYIMTGVQYGSNGGSFSSVLFTVIYQHSCCGNIYFTCIKARKLSWVIVQQHNFLKQIPKTGHFVIIYIYSRNHLLYSRNRVAGGEIDKCAFGINSLSHPFLWSDGDIYIQFKYLDVSKKNKNNNNKKKTFRSQSA